MTFSYLNKKIQDFIVENKIPHYCVIDNCDFVVHPQYPPFTVLQKSLNLAQRAQEENKNVYSIFLEEKLLCFVAQSEDDVINILSTKWNECSVFVFED
jgi:hypothetical protein